MQDLSLFQRAFIVKRGHNSIFFLIIKKKQRLNEQNNTL